MGTKSERRPTRLHRGNHEYSTDEDEDSNPRYTVDDFSTTLKNLIKEHDVPKVVQDRLAQLGALRPKDLILVAHDKKDLTKMVLDPLGVDTMNPARAGRAIRTTRALWDACNK